VNRSEKVNKKVGNGILVWPEIGQLPPMYVPYERCFRDFGSVMRGSMEICVHSAEEQRGQRPRAKIVMRENPHVQILQGLDISIVVISQPS